MTFKLNKLKRYQLKNVIIIKRNSIKCSQCDETFPGGHEYRMHWEIHLNEFLKKQKNERKEFN